jgi:hypothetical protein
MMTGRGKSISFYTLWLTEKELAFDSFKIDLKVYGT